MQRCIIFSAGSHNPILFFFSFSRSIERNNVSRNANEIQTEISLEKCDGGSCLGRFICISRLVWAR